MVLVLGIFVFPLCLLDLRCFVVIVIVIVVVGVAVFLLSSDVSMVVVKSGV